MKHTITVIIGALIFSVMVISSCKKDDDTPQRNHFKVGDTEYELAAAAIENWGLWDEDGDVYNLDLTLVSSEIGLSTDAFGYADFSGSGQMLYFEMFTSNPSTLDNGDYHLDTISPYPIGTFDFGDYVIGWVEGGNDNDWIDISSGKISVNKTANQYEITINCTDEKGQAITGYYKGTLKYFDYDNKSKSQKIHSKSRHF